MSGLFSAEFLSKLEGLHLLARQIARGRQRAERRSRKRGSGLEFADYRGISPGDDVRQIDWKAYARSRHLLLKLFEEEEDLHVHILLDATASMAWGLPPKFDLARQLAAGLAYLALANLDRAGVAPIGPSRQDIWATGRGRARFLRLLRYLEHLRAEPGDFPLADGVGRWLASRPRRGLVIWITDAWGTTTEDAFNALDRLRYAKQEVGLIRLRHDNEIHAGETGEFELRDVETGSTRTIIIDESMASGFRKLVAGYESRMADYCARHGLAHIVADAASGPLDILRNALLAGGFVR